jgi:hypothetical protein
MNKLKLKDIADAVCDATGLDIRFRTRKQEHVFARIVYAKIARTNTLESLEKIGKEIGVKHDTTLYYIKRFDEDLNFGINKKTYEFVLNELGIYTEEARKEIKDTNLDSLQLSVLRDLKELRYDELLEFNETRLKPFKKALESRIKPKEIIEVAGAMLRTN